MKISGLLSWAEDVKERVPGTQSIIEAIREENRGRSIASLLLVRDACLDAAKLIEAAIIERESE